ncbi:ABC transporter, substrate-binding lipoprotein [[Clostridium] ultunense Esp]|uniref:ABC transporter, substrate-binding lipoprotein n=1 Tax=[Clostridium] ultunense Esp TaxID=1288971 RepID=M1Z711_9FIRM|nr:MqnA/MqnD/SBP family protein [Schnuerera ultunensis]CCQ93529.1 ABC transporter, substrate-binding lipoprotein [[Clostridium] ultunense Esp]SHD75468.1 ABC transporter, substrate-binding lipoprotein [[Clostridium] ultunense Esp]
MKKKYLFLFNLIIIFSIVTSCGTKEVKRPETIEFCFRDGIPALTVAKLMKEDPIIAENITINYGMQKSPDLLVSKILKEEADIAIVPSNLAAQAFNKGLSYKLIGTSTWGTIYLASTEDIESFEELKDKEIYAFGKGLTPDLVLRFVLSQNGINPDEDVKLTYLNSASEVGPAFISGKTNIALLAEPLATNIMMKKDDAKIIFDLNKEWSNITGTDKGYPQASLIIKSDLIEDNIKFVEKFIDLYEKSIEWANENPEELGDYAEELELGVEKKVIMQGIERINIGSFPIKDSKKEYEIYYDSILDFAPDYIGGKIPDEEIYFEK